ncbi:MAG: response regulator [Anaerolineales bacterium]
MPRAQFSRPIEILMVEDCQEDARLTQEALQGARFPCNFNVVEDGDEALSYLRQEGKHENAARPDFILLDLTLPKRDGREVLVDIKQDPRLKRIPIVVLTGSVDEGDVLQSYDQHANSYIAKPSSMAQFAEVVKSIESFWLSIVKLPPE